MIFLYTIKKADQINEKRNEKNFRVSNKFLGFNSSKVLNSLITVLLTNPLRQQLNSET